MREYLPATIGTRSAIPSDARFSVDISDDGVANVDMNEAALHQGLR
ncbi:MAG: hypothetical protein R2715_13875 [Ilumatobacteraceae bacterium]